MRVAVSLVLLASGLFAQRFAWREIPGGRLELTENGSPVMVVNHEGLAAGDVQPLARLQVTCIAEENGNRQVGSFGGGGRIGFEWFREQDRYVRYAKEAARQAILNLSAVEAPAGVMPVVLGGGWPGILLHEMELLGMNPNHK